MSIDNGASEKPKENDEQVVQLESQLAEFLQANLTAKIKRLDGDSFVISDPWGDDSFHIKIPSDPVALINALNSIELPERLIGLWHRDTKRLEIIYTAFPLPFEDIPTRTFTFHYGENDYTCSYGPSSEQTLLIAENFIALKVSESSFRNLHSLRTYQAARKQEHPTNLKPLSFWIDGITWGNDEDIVDLLQHLNFYMSCYDANSPRIWVLPPKSENLTPHPLTRFPYNKFPTAIIAREIDDTLLRFWEASLGGDPIRRFLYNYQVLEYGAFYFLQDEMKRSLRKCLTAPHAISEPDDLIQQVVDLLSEGNLTDAQKIEALVKNVVNPEVLWSEISKNSDHFSHSIIFDGGVVLEPLIQSNGGIGDFKSNGFGKFAPRITKIRNGVAHGREHRMSKVITPTEMNFHRLEPWASLIAMAAREVILYRHIA
jgi:hypothetical protein